MVRLGLLAALPLLAGCEEPNGDEAAQAPPPAVVVEPVTMEDVSARAQFIGRTEAFQLVELRARVSGFLVEMNFNEGGQVDAGDVLFRIDPREYQASVQMAEASLAEAKATRAAAVKDVERARTLIKRGNIAQSALDEREAAAARAEADVQSAIASLTQAQLNLDYTEIVAPNSGRIGTANYDVGNLVGPESGSLATIVTLDPIYATFDVDERALLRLQKRRAAAANNERYSLHLLLPDNTRYEAPGRIDAISNRVDPTTGTIQIRAKFPNPDEILLPGQFVVVEAVTEETQRKPTVPQAAIQENQQGAFVLVVDADNRVSARPVETGQRVETRWVIEGGLEAGENVIVQGIQKVRPGGQVKPVPIAEMN